MGGYAVKLAMEFVTSFKNLYLEDAEKANIEGRLGFTYWSLAFLAFLFNIFFIPETRNIKLEEMDTIFGSNTSSETEKLASSIA